MDLILRNSTITDAVDTVDIAIHKGRIAKIASRIEENGETEIDVKGNMVSPGFVDSHMHLDKALTAEGDKVPRWNSEKDLVSTEGLVKGKVKQARDLYKEFTVQDVRERAIRCAKMAVRHGITTARTHVDINSDVGLTGFKGVLEAKQALKGLIDIQIVAFPQYGFCADPQSENLVKEALKSGAELVGGHDHDLSRGIDENLETTLRIAKEFNRGVDVHFGNNGTLGTYALEKYAELAIKMGLEGRVAASHCFGLATAPENQVDNAVQMLKKARVGVVSCYHALFPTFPLKKLVDAGVTVGVGSDNVRDWWNPFGTSDILQGVLSYCDRRKCAMTSNERLQQVFDIITFGGARVLGIEGQYGIKEGSEADLVVLEANSPQWAIITQAKKLYVIKNGKVVAKDAELHYT